MVALVLVALVALALRQYGVALTHTKTVLDCPAAAGVAHTHNADCYDSEGNLVCPLPEVELHTHDDSCYTETRTLVCGLPESEEHTHTDDCYEVTRTLTCGKDEVTEEHVHGPGCFKTVTVDEGAGADDEPTSAADTSADEVAHPAQSFEQELKETDGEGREHVVLAVSVEAPEGALPEGSTMEVKRLEAHKVEAAATAAVAAKTDDQVTSLLAVDITFRDAHGTEVEPLRKVTVRFAADTIKACDESFVVHVDDKGEGTVVDALTDKQLKDRGAPAAAADELLVDTDAFSPYVIVGTTIAKNVLASDGQNYQVKVTYGDEAGLPADVGLSVQELTGDDAGQYVVGAAYQMGAESFAYARVFDITLIDAAGNHLTPATPVEVSVELLDTDHGPGDFAVVHFAGATGEPEQMDVAAEGNAISFETESFSAYAIVQGPTEAASDWTQVKTMTDLQKLASTGLYLGTTSGFFLTNTTATGKLDSKTTGIVKTTPASTYPPEETAAIYYFEAVEGSDNAYYLYCLDGSGAKQYVRNTGDQNLYLTTTASERTAFTVQVDKNGRFRMNNGNRYWNMWNGVNGNHIACYTNPTDGNNYFNIWQYDPLESDPYGLDGTSYGLVRWDGDTTGKALMASSSATGALDALSMTVMSKAGSNADKLFVANDSDISMWDFAWVAGDTYHLTTTVDGTTKYLQITADGVALVDTPDDNCTIQVVPGTGTHAGEISLKAGGKTLTYSGDVNSGFTVSGSAGNEWLKLTETSELTADYIKPYSATKISVSDPTVTNGSRIIVYTRVWDETTKKYQFYAIDHDGTLVPCYESGNTINWVGTTINTLLWNFVEYFDESTGQPTYYYDLYNQYSEKYLAPQLTDGQILSDEAEGINLTGRRNGKYYSSIVEWDDDRYAYAGLTADVAEGTVASCPFSEVGDFYFAVLQDADVDDVLHTVATVDNDEHGITMKMTNFANRASMTSFLGSDDGYKQGNTEAGLLSTQLGADGYPTTKANNSLSSWFADADTANHLFIQSTYDETGYFEYSSTQNFAHLDQTTGDFTVYQEIGTTDNASSKFYTHGQFFPYNDIKAGTYSTRNTNLTNALGQTLPDSDPRKYEQLYVVQNPSAPDYYLGMEVEASFTQTPDGLDDWDHDIIYEFTGDDDFWLYVDGELVIDLGGIHDALPGSVNFRTGEVVVNGSKTTLRQIFEKNYRQRNAGATDDEVTAYLDQYFKDGGTVFKDYTTHTMKIFYLERGAGASNLHMRFNLASVKAGTVELSKELAGIDASESVLAEFPYQVWYQLPGENEGDAPTERLLTNPNAVMYKDTINLVPYQDRLTMADGTSYDSVFLLKSGETAVIDIPDDAVGYRIVECGVNTDVYEGVTVNGEEVVGTAVAGASNRKDYGIDYAPTKDRQRVKYTNEVKDEAVRTLTISKKLFKADGVTPIAGTDDATTFNFRLYLGMEFDAAPALANMHTYHVKTPEGAYCAWDSSQKAFVSIGKSNYDELTDEEKTSVSFATSMNGSISKIPVDYIVEIREVLAGTQYQVEEREKEIPDGYSLQKYVRYDEGAQTTGEDSHVPAQGSVVAGKDPHVDVCNLKGWGLRVNKVWPDEDFMTARDATYFALFTRAADDTLTLVDDSVRQMAYGTTTLYWYYRMLPVAGVDLDHYEIREVTLSESAPTVDDEGVVTNFGTVTPLAGGSTLTLNGTQKGEATSSPFGYTVAYEKGALDLDSNVRVDTCTNSRTGIVLKKLQWDGTTPLAGATFVLTDEEGTEIGTFTSDDAGLITTAFLSEDKTYTLTETKTPPHYHGLEAPLHITQADGTVTVQGEDEAYFEVVAEGVEQTEVHIKNRPYTFEAVKVDADTNVPMQNVTFALYKQHTVDGVSSFDVVAGYESLKTDAQGVVPQLDNTLSAGTYELREVSTPQGYQQLTEHVRFRVTSTGVITKVSDQDEASLAALETEDEAGTLRYVLTIPNHKLVDVTLNKVDAQGAALKGAKFALCVYGGSWVTVGSYGDIDLTKNATVVLSSLRAGRYRLEETQVPDGYVALDRYVYFNVVVDEAGTVSVVLTDEAGTGDNANDAASVSGLAITVQNTPGTALPAAGGMGTTAFALVGAVLVVVAGAALFVRRRA